MPQIKMNTYAKDRRISLNHLMYVKYQHTDTKEAQRFAHDFGLIPVEAAGDSLYYRGFGKDPVCYITEKTTEGKSAFIGGGWVVDEYKDLEFATTIAGASQITDSPEVIGGKMVILIDPNGGLMFLHYGGVFRSISEHEKPVELTFNTWNVKRRRGEFQRLPDGPSHVHKLGHYGYEVNHGDFDATCAWYFGNFTLSPTDTLYNPKTGKNIMVFAHLERGEEFVDHHSFFLTAGDVTQGFESHHTSFEVDDIDSELKGHIWLEKKGWELCWGVGRHLLGSQVFDYWFNQDDFVMEHYADGDLVNCHTKPEYVEATPDSISIWGPSVPLFFLTRKAEDRGKILPEVRPAIEARGS